MSLWQGKRLSWRLLAVGVLASTLVGLSALLGPGGIAQAQEPPLNSSSPTAPVRLVFIHHSVGEAWLADGVGNLRQTLNNRNYYVLDTNYGWGPDAPELGGAIGEFTDIGHWYNWFLGPDRRTFMSALYGTSHLTGAVGANTIPAPGGSNTVVMFKSCYPNGQGIQGDPTDPPRVSSVADPNPLWEESAGGEHYTVSNIKGLYRDLLAYFAARQNRLFILITTPPSYRTAVNYAERANARAISTWLTRHLLDAYPYNNVAVFDYFNVLTSNGGSPNLNDLGAETGNHHRLQAGVVQHVIGLKSNVSAYPDGTDSHPTAAGHRKAKGEFAPLLNVAYHAWKGNGGRPLYMGRTRLLSAVPVPIPPPYQE
jgi:hypothetical protein